MKHLVVAFLLGLVSSVSAEFATNSTCTHISETRSVHCPQVGGSCDYFPQTREVICGFGCKYFAETRTVQCADNKYGRCDFFPEVSTVVCGINCRYFSETKRVHCVLP